MAQINGRMLLVLKTLYLMKFDHVMVLWRILKNLDEILFSAMKSVVFASWHGQKRSLKHFTQCFQSFLIEWKQFQLLLSDLGRYKGNFSFFNIGENPVFEDSPYPFPAISNRFLF